MHRLTTKAFYNKGEMVEWSITAVLKTAVPRGTGGSNPSLSANKGVNHVTRRFTPNFIPKIQGWALLYPKVWSLSRRLYMPDQTQIQNGRAELVPIENARLTKAYNPPKKNARITNKKIEHDMEQLAGKLDKFNVDMGINSK